MKTPRMHMLMCFGTSCISSGVAHVKDALDKELAKRNLADEVSIVKTGCNGFCAGGPIMVVYPGGYFYQRLAAEDAVEIVDEHVLKGRPVERLMFRHPVTQKPVPFFKDIPFFSRQNLRVLRNKGRIAAEKIEEYIAQDGYAALARALTEMKPEQIIDEVKKSGLRGRGGAGFPTGIKWEFCRKAKGDQKYIICNADEGDPGAFMDRSVLESDPHAVLEGMMIAARAIGADTGYIYCRAEYPLALERLECAIGQCREMGLLGKNILDTDFCFDIFICQGSGAFVCGEETALMRSIEGHRGEPRPRPPFPAQKGLWEKPSVLNNVETLANVPLIIHHGADWFRSVGTKGSTGTKIFALTGDVNNIGLVEVNMGITLGDIVYDIGGGIPNGKKFKAAQLGGPSGGCICKENLNVPIDYESVTELGAIMGSGGLIVMDEDTCMVDMARFFLEFTQDESCGKCSPCRIGTKRMLEIVTRICEGQGEEGDVEKLVDLGKKVKDTALCGLGQTAPNPVLSTIRYFRDEYDAHIREKKCRAGVCPALVRAPCQNACPAGVDVPGYVSLIGEKRYAEALRLHRERNPFAAVCARVCFHTCEDKCRRSNLDESLSIRGLKRFMVDQEVTIQLPEIRDSEENAKQKIAIIGAGPAGLSCGYFLARLGYRPKVFEAEPRPGGMLVQAIPAYRLPREIVAREVRMIERMGVDIETNTRLGQDFTLPELRAQGYRAVFLGLGAPLGSRMGVPGEDAEGVAEAICFLRDYNLRGSVPVGEKVVVIGGGNAAVDAARTAVRLGAKSVTILYRRTRDEMPAYAEEIEEAEHEGVVLQTLVAPVEILAKNGRVAGIKCQRMTLGPFDSSGRRRPEPNAEKAFVIETDHVIAAIGQAIDPKGILDGIDLKLTSRNFIRVNPITGQTSVEWLFAGGDAALGPSSVAIAVKGGETAAITIDQYITGTNHAFWREEKLVDAAFDSEADPAEYPRSKMRLIPVGKRRHNFDEVELPFSEAVALREAKRCLRCDYREKS
ncbi:MAG: NADH-quinone oxidoreductase subunit NuoF [Planctomycetota bacterium]